VVAELPSHALEADRGKVEMVHLIVMGPFEVPGVERDNVGIPDRVRWSHLDVSERMLHFLKESPSVHIQRWGLPLDAQVLH
jgi:hypothetical protein